MLENAAMRKIILILATAALSSTALAAKPPEPKTHSMDGCTWAWKSGAGIGFWAEDCDINTGKWRIDFDAASSSFVMTIDGKDAMPLVRVFDKEKDADIASLLPKLRKEKLVLDTDECQFMADTDTKLEAGRLAYQVMPTGKLKEAFDKLPTDEVPEPPCGEIGMLTDAVGYFMVDPKQPDKVLYLMLGQDQPLFDPTTITFE